MKLSLSEQLILGILAEKPYHGYEIEKLIQSRNMRKWTDIGFSSIYYILERLEQKGLAMSILSRHKSKKTYQITTGGMSELRNTTKQLLSARRPANTHFMTAVATSQPLDDSEMVQALRLRQGVLEIDYSDVRKMNAETECLPRSARQLLDLSERLVKTELDWVNDELKKLEAA